MGEPLNIVLYDGYDGYSKKKVKRTLCFKDDCICNTFDFNTVPYF